MELHDIVREVWTDVRLKDCVVEVVPSSSGGALLQTSRGTTLTHRRIPANASPREIDELVLSTVRDLCQPISRLRVDAVASEWPPLEDSAA